MVLKLAMPALLLWFSLCSVWPAAAIDPGRVQGILRVNDEDVVLNQAYAHLHDNAEKLLDYPRELRILMTDREVAQEYLAGINLGKLEGLVREGRFRGVLLRLDPGNPKRFTLTLLIPPPVPEGKLFARLITAVGPPAPLNIKLSPQRVGGSLDCPQDLLAADTQQPSLRCSLKFSAPVFNEPPVTAIFTGQAALDSFQNRVLEARKRDLPPRGSDPSSADGPPATLELSPKGTGLAVWRQQLQRVVVRGRRATAIFAAGQWQSFIKDGATWRLEE